MRYLNGVSPAKFQRIIIILALSVVLVVYIGIKHRHLEPASVPSKLLDRSGSSRYLHLQIDGPGLPPVAAVAPEAAGKIAPEAQIPAAGGASNSPHVLETGRSFSNSMATSSDSSTSDSFIISEEEQLRNPSDLTSVFKKFQERMGIMERPVVNRHDFSYILNVPGACEDKDVELVIGVPSRIQSFDQRQSVRETWGQVARNATEKTVLLFFFGKAQDEKFRKRHQNESKWKAKELQERLLNESKTYGDIVQEDFMDSYRNLSLKSVAIVRWISVFCPESNFALKADDDMYINIPLLMKSLRTQLRQQPIFIMGMLQKYSKPYRYVTHKWFVPYSQYNSSIYPEYVSGTAYSMTTTAALRLYVESFYVRPINMEDTYITGILARSATVPRIHEPKFSGHKKVQASGCLYRSKICGHDNSPKEMKLIHMELYDMNLDCGNFKNKTKRY